MTKFSPTVIILKNQKKSDKVTFVLFHNFPLYIFIELLHPQGPQNAFAFRLAKIIEEKFKNHEYSYQQLENALKEINNLLKKMVLDGEIELVNNLSAAILLFEKTFVHFASIGQIGCFLIRDKNITSIGEEKNEEIKTFSDIVSGEIINGDKIVLGNKNFNHNIPLNFLRQTFLNYSLQEAGEKIVTFLKRERIKNVAAFLFEIKENEKVSTSTTFYLDENRWQKIFSFFQKSRHKLTSCKIPISLSLRLRITSFSLNKTFWRNVFVIIIAAILIGGGTLLSRKIKNQQQTQNENTRKILMTAEDKKREGDKAQQSNNKLLAEQLYRQAIELAKQVKTKEAQELIKKISNEIDQMYRIERTEAKQILDLNFLDNATVSQIFAVDKNIYFIDKNSRKIFQNKNEKTTIPHAAGEIVAATLQPPEQLLLIYCENEGLLEYSIEENTLNKAKNILDEQWRHPDSLATFFSNLYFLDSKEGQVYKYEKIALGYSKAIPYVKSTKTGIKNSLSLVVDGYVYVLKNDGTIIKFLGGNPVKDFQLRNIPETENYVNGGSKIATSVDVPYLFILAQNKIIVLEKNGEYKKTYLITNIQNIADIFLNYKNKTLFLLSQNKVYKIELSVT